MLQCLRYDPRGQEGMLQRLTPIALAVMLLAAHAAQAVPRLEFGVMDGLALDQPRVLIGIEDPANPGVVVGPDDFFNTAALDTGADSILIVSPAYLDSTTFDSDPDRYELERRDDDSIVQYEQVGIGGSELFDLLKPYNLAYVGPEGGATTQLNNVRFTGSPDTDLSDLAGVVGMPAMVGHVVTWDFRPVSDFSFIDVAFDDTRPAATDHSYHINLERFNTEASGQIQPDDPLPVLTDLPLVPDVITGGNGTTATGQYLLDSGAATTLITAATAADLGIDLENDAIDFLQVGGIGGEAFLPVVEIDTITLPTAEGVDMVFEDINAAVVDIEGLDIAGILGSNALMTGYLNALGTGEAGVYHQAVLDFTDPAQWVMRLDVNPDFDNVLDPALPGDANRDGEVGIQDLAILSEHFGLGPYGEWTEGDYNGDGLINIQDLALLSEHFGLSSIPTSTVTQNTPQPGAGVMLIAMFGLFIRRRRLA